LSTLFLHLFFRLTQLRKSAEFRRKSPNIAKSLNFFIPFFAYFLPFYTLSLISPFLHKFAHYFMTTPSSWFHHKQITKASRRQIREVCFKENLGRYNRSVRTRLEELMRSVITTQRKLSTVIDGSRRELSLLPPCLSPAGAGFLQHFSG